MDEQEAMATNEGFEETPEVDKETAFEALQGLMRDVSAGRKTVRTTDEGWLLFENAKDDDV